MDDLVVPACLSVYVGLLLWFYFDRSVSTELMPEAYLKLHSWSDQLWEWVGKKVRALADIFDGRR